MADGPHTPCGCGVRAIGLLAPRPCARAGVTENDMRENAVRATLRVRYSEVDLQGIVYNSRYLEYLDVALGEFLRARGIDLMETAARDYFDTTVVKATLEYLAPARVDQQLDVWAWLERIGTKSFTFGFAIFPTGTEQVLVRAEVIYVNYSAARRAAMPVPPDIRTALQGG